eukprot:817472_1
MALHEKRAKAIEALVKFVLKMAYSGEYGALCGDMLKTMLMGIVKAEEEQDITLKFVLRVMLKENPEKVTKLMRGLKGESVQECRSGKLVNVIVKIGELATKDCDLTKLKLKHILGSVKNVGSHIFYV